MEHGDSARKKYSDMKKESVDDAPRTTVLTLTFNVALESSSNIYTKSRFWDCCKHEPVYERHTTKSLGRKSRYITCPNCRQPIKTNVTYINVRKTKIAAIILLPICCCFLPFLLPCCKMAKHTCPVCNVYIGIC